MNMTTEKHKNFEYPNFRNKEGKLFLVRCFECEPDGGKENYAPNVAEGVCTWCGWREKRDNNEKVSRL